MAVSEAAEKKWRQAKVWWKTEGQWKGRKGAVQDLQWLVERWAESEREHWL